MLITWELVRLMTSSSTATDYFTWQIDGFVQSGYPASGAPSVACVIIGAWKMNLELRWSLQPAVFL